MTKYRPITDADKIALENFARCFGRSWKAKLAEVYWPNARVWVDDKYDSHDGTLLHSLRNSHGPEWLAKYKLAR